MIWCHNYYTVYLTAQATTFAQLWGISLSFPFPSTPHLKDTLFQEHSKWRSSSIGNSFLAHFIRSNPQYLFSGFIYCPTMCPMVLCLPLLNSCTWTRQKCCQMPSASIPGRLDHDCSSVLLPSLTLEAGHFLTSGYLALEVTFMTGKLKQKVR